VTQSPDITGGNMAPAAAAVAIRENGTAGPGRTFTGPGASTDTGN
jgi:hypothetical protein